MLMPKAKQKQKYFVKDNSNINESINSAQASANMYDQLTDSFLQLSDIATTSAINAEIRDSDLEGEMSGIEGSRKDEDGSFKGYDKKSELFTWDVASNKASKASFEANVSGRASSTMKTLAKDVDGNKQTYKNVSQELLNNALKNVTDEQQRQHITNAYAKSYNQNMSTVSARYMVREAGMAKMGWDDGRTTFEEDYSVKLSSIARDGQKLATATQDDDRDKMTYYMDKIDESREQLVGFKKARISKGQGGIQLGVLTEESVEANTHADIVKAIGTSITQSYSEAGSVEDKTAIRAQVANMPEGKGTTEEVYYMSPTSKKAILEALDSKELQEQKMWSSIKSRGDKEFAIEKKSAVSEIQTGLVLEPDDTIEKIEDAFKAGYISLSERKAYLSHAVGGSEVERDSWGTYTDVKGNVEDFTIEEISNMTNLTDATKRKFIADRMAWEEEGVEWMSAPDYREGKNVIKETYGYPDASILPEFIDPKKKQRYIEMQGVIQQYRDEVRASVAKDARGNSVAIAERLLKIQKDDITSKLRPLYKEDKIVTKAHLDEEVKETGKGVIEIMKRQVDQFPESTPSSDVSKEMSNEPPKTIKEDGFFPWSTPTDKPNPEHEKWNTRMRGDKTPAENPKPSKEFNELFSKNVRN